MSYFIVLDYRIKIIPKNYASHYQGFSVRSVLFVSTMNHFYKLMSKINVSSILTTRN